MAAVHAAAKERRQKMLELLQQAPEGEMEVSTVRRHFGTSNEVHVNDIRALRRAGLIRRTVDVESNVRGGRQLIQAIVIPCPDCAGSGTCTVCDGSRWVRSFG